MNNELMDIMKWWEQKRLIYNVFLGGTQITMMALYGTEILEMGLVSAIFLSLLYAIGANVMYCLGWAVEFLVIYYFGAKTKPIGNRYFLLILGTVFSVVFTLVQYEFTLAGPYWFIV